MTEHELNLVPSIAMRTGHKDYHAIFSLARYAGLRIEECCRIDTNDAQNAIDKCKELFKM